MESEITSEDTVISVASLDHCHKISNLQIKKEQVERQIKDLEGRFQKMLQGSCIICMNNINNPVLEPSCQNLFCGDCLFEWLKKHDTCPTCRIKINPKNLIYVKSNKNNDSNQITKERKKTKLEMVIDIITAKPEGKFLIYSAYDETFKPICNILKENKISFVMLKGNHNSKQAILNDYKQGDIKVIFLNSNCNSAGLNLQETTDIILYHDMLTSTQTQIIGRAERIGRVGVLNVHHLSIEKDVDI
jgi:SNF2 family DNA or RNA helicase